MDIRISNAIRFLSIDAVEKAKSGHPGMPMGMADVASILFTEFIKINPKDPLWPDRDRFILSNGHGSMLIYSLLYLLGYKEPTINDIKNFRKLGSKTPGHPEFEHTIGIETTTGPLGQGIGNAVGMALAERKLNLKFGNSLVNHFTYAFAGDGCLMEGLSHEALSLAGHLNLNKLIIFYDDNGISIDGSTQLSFTDDTEKRLNSYGWNYIKIDGHNHNSIRSSIKKAQKSKKPTMIACKTKIGFGSPNKVNSHESHGAPLGKDEIELTRKNLNWNYKPFVIPKDILGYWRKAGKRSLKEYSSWKLRLKKSKNIRLFNTTISNDLSLNILEKSRNEFNKLNANTEKISTRKASQLSLDVLNKNIPKMIGGSADLTPSNNTKSKELDPIAPDNLNGRYVHYGVREHGMASIMNGLSLHGGFIPYGGTFLVFSDYCRPSIRLSAMMGLKVIYVMTHDSIGLGEDGPTHQPVEHIMSLRLIPNLKVFRPADLYETFDSWIEALKGDGSSIIALSRQDLKVLNTSTSKRLSFYQNNFCNIISGNLNKRDLTIVATGSEVEIGYEASLKLAKKGINSTVISIPCIEQFNTLSPAKKSRILGSSPIIFVEAGVSVGWRSILKDNSNIVSVDTFGASGPKNDVYEHFKITKEEIVKKAIRLCSN